MQLLCLASAHSRSSVPSMRKIVFATSTPLSGSGLINGIEAIIFCCLVKNYDKRLSFVFGNPVQRYGKKNKTSGA